MNLVRFLTFLVLFFPLTCQAVGVSVNPSSLDLLYPSNTQPKITIKNISSEPIIVKVLADDFSKNISVSPNEVSLLPDEITQVKVSSDFQGYQMGVQNTHLSVISQAIDKRSFNAASGIKIPLTINISGSSFKWSAEAVFAVAFVSLLFVAMLLELIFAIIRYKRKRSFWHRVDFLSHHRKLNRFKFKK